MTTHAKLSASSSHRWLHCPGSIKAEEGYADSSSEHANEGSAAHWLGETCLESGQQASEFLGQTLADYQVVVTDEMVDAVQQYLDYVRSLGGNTLIEQRVDFSHVVPEGFGTADAIVMSGDTLHIVDLKYGKGVKVYAENNSQAMLYALGVMHDFDYLFQPEKIVLTIVQPRLDHIDEWEVTMDQLQTFASFAQTAANLALQDNAPRYPSDKACQWCKAKAECVALKNEIEQTLSASFDAISEIPKPDKLTLEQISNILSSKKLVSSFLEAVEKFAMARLSNGEDMPGFKLVAGRSNRVISDEDFAVRILHQSGYKDEQIYKPVALKSITELEKLMGKKEFSLTLGDVVVKPEGAPTIAPTSDPRAPLSVVNASDFGC